MTTHRILYTLFAFIFGFSVGNIIISMINHDTATASRFILVSIGAISGIVFLEYMRIRKIKRLEELKKFIEWLEKERRSNQRGGQ